MEASVEATISKLHPMGIECFIIDLDNIQNFIAIDELDRVNTALTVRLSIRLDNLIQLVVLLLAIQKLVVHKEAN